MSMNNDSRPIGVFDSGLGGISVLRELVKLMPGEDYVYFGDSANAPYGTKTPQQVTELTVKNVEFLLAKGAKAIVVACNTATSAAIGTLREMYGEVPIIGIEPALKPAVMAHSTVLVMATPMTLELDRFNRMLRDYEDRARIIKMPCPGLVELIEQGILDGPVLRDYLEEHLKPWDKASVDAVVLGCTHYPLIRDVIQAVLPGAAIFDGGEGTARQTQRRLAEQSLLSGKPSAGTVSFYNSKNDPEVINLCERLLRER